MSVLFAISNAPGPLYGRQSSLLLDGGSIITVYSTQVLFADNDPSDSWDRSVELLDAEGLDLLEEYKEVVYNLLMQLRG